MGRVINLGDVFKKESQEELLRFLRTYGPRATENALLDSGYSKSNAKIFMKRLLRKAGW